MKLKKEWLENSWARYTVATCSAVLLYLILTHLNTIGNFFATIFHYISPVFYGIVIAYILHPAVNKLEAMLKKKTGPNIARVFAVALTFVIFIVALALLLVMLITPVMQSVFNIVNNLDSYVEQLNKLLSALGAQAALKDIDVSSLIKMATSALSSVTTLVPNKPADVIVTSLNIGVSVFNWIISCIIAIYLLVDTRNIIGGFRRLMKAVFDRKQYRAIAQFWKRCDKILIQFIVYDLIDGLIIGVSNAIFMTIAGMDWIPLISVVVGVTNLAPTFGPIVGGIIGAFLLMLVNPLHALIFIIFTMCLQTFDGYILKPKLFGDSLGVPPVSVLIFIIVMGRIFGVVGILLAIPFSAIFDFVYNEAIIPSLEDRRKMKEIRKKQA